MYMNVLLELFDIGCYQNAERKTERNGKWNETGNEIKISKENKFMNFVDTTVYKGKRFEIKQNLDFYSNLSKKIIFFEYLDPPPAHNPSVFKGFLKFGGGMHRSSSLSYRASKRFISVESSDLRDMADGRSHFFKFKISLL